MTKNIDTDEEIAYTFRQRFAEARLQNKISFKEIAEKSGINITQVSHFATGQRLPNYQNLYHLAKAMNVSVDFLMGLSAQNVNALEL